MTIEDMNQFTKIVDVINNRVSIINQTCGYGCNNYADAPCVCGYVRGRYCVTWCGSEYAEWRVYDLEGAAAALARLDALGDCVWYAARASLLRMPTNDGKVSQRSYALGCC